MAKQWHGRDEDSQTNKFLINPPLYFYRIPNYFTPVQLFHNYPGDEFQLCCKWRKPWSKADLVVLDRYLSLAVQKRAPWDTLCFSNWELLCAVCAIHLWSCSTLNLFLDLLTWNLNVIVALNCSLGLCLENNEFTRELVLKVQSGHKPYLLRSRIMDTGTVSSLNPGKKAPGSKPDFVDIFNYVLLVKQ